MSTSRHVQHLDPVDLPRQAGRRPATPFAWVVDTGSQPPLGRHGARVAEREPTFDELVRGTGAARIQGEERQASRTWFGRRGARSRRPAPTRGASR